MKQKSKHRILLSLFFASGISALVYEILWVRWLTLLTGTTQQAVGIVLAVFFTGLALGSFLTGKFSARIKKPIFVYGLVEILVGFWALASPLFIHYLANLTISQTSLFGGVVALLFPPTVLLGTTFPLLIKALGKKHLPFLYGLNTLGAILGVLLAGFFFPPLLGLSQTVRIAGILSVAVGIIALKIGPKAIVSKRVESNSRLTNYELQINKSLILFILFIGGFAALALEVLWTKLLVMVMGGSIYNFSTVLIVYLLGIALGSLFVGKIKIKKPAQIFFISQAVIGIGVIVALLFVDRLPLLLFDILQKASSNFWLVTTIEAGMAGTAIFIPTFFMGITFPLAIKLLGGEGGQDAGYAYGINTFGGVLGSVFAGFVFIPFLGLQKSVLVMGMTYLFLAGILVIAFRLKRGLLVFLGGIMVLAMLLPSWDRKTLTSGVYSHGDSYLSKWQDAKLIFYQDGWFGTVTVREFPDGGRVMQTNGKVESSTTGDLDTQLLSGHLPLLFHSNPENVLVIGLGGGFSLGAVTTHPEPEKIDMIEIEPAVVEAASYFSDFNEQALKDKRVNLVIDDARSFLRNNQKKYDVIASEPSNPWLTGVSNLFTKEFFELAKSHLKEDGIMGSWIHLYSMSPGDLLVSLRTFQEVFPYVQVWTNSSGVDLLLLGSSQPLPTTPGKVKLENERVKVSLRRIYIDSNEELSGYFLLDNEEISLLTEGARIHTDNFPILEFSAPKSLYRPTVVENLRLLEKVFQTKETKWSIFRKNLIEAEIARRDQNEEKAIAAYKKALEIDSNNRQIASFLANIMITKVKVFVREGKIDEALSLCDEVKEIYPEGHLAYREKGEILLSQGRAGEAFYLPSVSEAEKEFLQAAKLADYDAQTHIDLGIVYGIYGNYEKSEKEFLRAIEISPSSTLAWNNLAKAYLDQGKKTEARDVWKKSLKINSKQPEVRKAIIKIK